MAKDPAFLFYYQDWLVGTYFLKRREKGAYMDLLCYQADKDYLTIEDVKDILNGDFDCWDKLKDKFVEEDGKLYNKRLRLEKEKRSNFSESRRNNVKKRYESTNDSTYAPTYVPTSVVHMENENENKDEDYNKELLEEIISYGKAKNISKEVCESYFHYYERQGWLNGNGMKIVNRKSGLINWAKDKRDQPKENKTCITLNT